jgi:VWFA-related protein
VVQCFAAAPGARAADSKPFIECDRAELVQAVPELAGIQFDPSEDRPAGLLQATGERLRGIFAKPLAISAAEDIHEMRFEDSMAEASRRESFRYVLRPLPAGEREPFEEVRMDPKSELVIHAPPKSDFVIMGHFFKLLRYLLPENRNQSRFRYLGRWTARGQDYFVVAFAQRPEGAGLQIEGPSTPLLQGLVWIDSATNRLARLRLDLLARPEDFPFKTLTTDILLAPFNFQSVGTEFLLPARVIVNAQYPGGEVYSVHRYSKYRLNGIGDQNEPSAPATSTEDAWELLDRGISRAKENKTSEAVTVFREALALNADLPIGQYHLAAALRSAGDLAGAEAELREAVKRVPNSGPVHNFLGILMFKRGDVVGAVAELRTSAQLQPKDAAAHFNLGQALEKLGDRKAALEEYRTASMLSPDNAAFKERYTLLERNSNVLPSAAADTTIKVEVRQVLVPVIVTDKEGHHVTGLTQADFRVFDDGVEQKISGFSVEDAGMSSPAPVAATAAAEAPSAGTAPNRRPIRRTYLICIDSFHSAFANLVHVREALSRLFQEEQGGDSQYILVAVGTSTKMVQNPTTDPGAVLKAVASKDFEKLFVGSRQGSTQSELRDFRRSLDEARAACDQGEPLCEPMKRSVTSEANQIASQERTYTLGFLTQFRSLVEAFGRGTERRSIILFSDGFQLVPGKEALELLSAYFPEMRSMALRTVDRMPNLEPILHLAANSNIPIYTIDSRGLYTSGFFDATNAGGIAAVMPAVLNVMNQNASGAGDTLSEIAAATGGMAFRNSNNILDGLERAFADGRQYYVVAYVPSSDSADGKFHSISVRVRDSKMQVNAKRGYWVRTN